MNQSSHGILGPGGVGGLIGAVLADAGVAVTFFVRPGSESLYPREVFLESPFKSLHASILIRSKPTVPVDVLWITVKATQLASALAEIPTDFRPKSVVPLLNGIDHLPFLRERFGYECVVPATISVESERVAPGRIIHRSPFINLSVLKQGHARLASVLEIFKRFGFECPTADSEATLMWRKLAFLAPIALATSASKSAIGEILGDPARAARLETAVREVCAVAVRDGASVEADAVFARIKSLPPGMRSSMQKDIAKGNPPELDAIAGPVLRRAEKYGITLKAIPELVREIGPL